MKYNLIILIMALSWAMPSYADVYYCSFDSSGAPAEVIKLEYNEGENEIKLSRHSDWEHRLLPIRFNKEKSSSFVSFSEDHSDVGVIIKHEFSSTNRALYSTQISTDTGKIHKSTGDCFHVIPEQLKNNADKKTSVLSCDKSKSDNLYCWDEKPN